MEKQIAKFRRQVEALFGGCPGPGVRYPEALKALAVKVALESIEEGEHLSTVARLLGVGVGTLRRWLEAEPVWSSPLRAVEVVRDADTALVQARPGGDLVLVTATGHRIEGLALAEVALLLESLG